MTAESAVDGLYRALESTDLERLGDLLTPDAFVFSPTASGVLTSAEAVVADLRGWVEAANPGGAPLRLRLEGRRVGSSDSQRCAWIFDELVAGGVPIRCTALVVLDATWRIAAAYWSIPYATQAEQDAVKAAGELEPGAPLEPAVTSDARPLADALQRALDEPALLPGLYSTRADHVTLGSVVDEVFVGAAGRAAWAEFVQYVSAFTVRGPMRGALVAPEVGWLAANIDIGQPPTPYRFFYIWLREEPGWRIVVSHDAVSRDPCRADGSICAS